MEVTCKNCDKKFNVKPSTFKRGGGRFCSKECFQDAKGQISVNCENCNKEFKVTPSRFKRGSGKHCSRICSDENRPVGPDNRPKFNCIVCKKEFRATEARKKMGNVSFCSKACRGIVQTEKNTVLRNCKGCNKEFRNSKSKEKKGEGKFCSDECRLINWKEIDRPGKLKGKDKTCPQCGILFYVQGASKVKFCSQDCCTKNKDRKEEFNCQICNKSFLRKPNQVKKGLTKYCSSKCRGKGNFKSKIVKCSFCDKEVYKTPGSIKKFKRSFCSVKCSRSFYKGENSPAWRGGVTSERKKQRDSKQYKEWRTLVFERDDYTCQSCKARNGKGKAVYLHAHHIKSFHNFPELRFELNNGVTLCIECHKETDNYGGKAKKSTEL